MGEKTSKVVILIFVQALILLCHIFFFPSSRMLLAGDKRRLRSRALPATGSPITTFGDDVEPRVVFIS